jgi:hypothetical protein
MELLKSILKNLDHPLLITNANGKTEYFNDKFSRQFEQHLGVRQELIRNSENLVDRCSEFFPSLGIGWRLSHWSLTYLEAIQELRAKFGKEVKK